MSNIVDNDYAMEDDSYDDPMEEYCSDLAGDFTLNDKKSRNKRSNTTCYSSKHTRQSAALKQNKKSVSKNK
jgi:hypothetical protein